MPLLLAFNGWNCLASINILILNIYSNSAHGFAIFISLFLVSGRRFAISSRVCISLSHDPSFQLTEWVKCFDIPNT